MAQTLRLIEQADLNCPAADTALTGRGVECRIEHHALDSRTEGRSLAAYCLGDYETCPTWRTDKEAHWRELDEP